jgi:ferredoxin
MRSRIERGLAVAGPALFSVYAGPDGQDTPLPPYLVAAAAMQSRGFPAFTYDASAGTTWATRFSLEDNPQPEQDWPVDTLEYADATLQRVREPCAFTFADFLLCDGRYAAHFAVLPRVRWSEVMLPVSAWLALDEPEAAQRIPFLWATDADEIMHRVIVDARLMEATRRCRLLWRRLQEHSAPRGAPASAAMAAAEAAPPSVAVEQAAEPPDRAPDEAWIETSRCPSCNECQLINDRMFKYNDRKQAYIADIGAGTFRQLVEAAEGCQVAIIHPGSPRDPAEPGLEDLIRRAEPFR